MGQITVSDEMLPYVLAVLERDNIFYRVDKNQVTVPLSGNQFHIVVEDAACEKERRYIPVYSFRTLQNKEKFARLRRLNKTPAFHLLKRDISRFLLRDR